MGQQWSLICMHGFLFACIQRIIILKQALRLVIVAIIQADTPGPALAKVRAELQVTPFQVSGGVLTHCTINAFSALWTTECTVSGCKHLAILLHVFKPVCMTPIKGFGDECIVLQEVAMMPHSITQKK